MRNASLMLVSLLRKLPRTSAFDDHLTDCAAYEAAYRVFDPELPPLRIASIIRLIPLGGFHMGDAEPMRQRAESPELSDNIVRFRRRIDPEVCDAI